MKPLAILTLLLALVPLASCASLPRPVDDRCAGWAPVLVGDATIDWLAAHDAAALRDLIAHQEFGRKMGCW